VTRSTLQACCLAALLASAVASTPAGAHAPPTLYARLGGAPAVERLAGTLIDRVAADPRTARSFEGSDLGRVKRLLAQQLCELAGGGCRYEGDSMREVHAGHEIREDEFYAMVEILEDVMREQGIALAERNALLRLLAPMKRDVVRVPVPGP